MDIMILSPKGDVAATAATAREARTKFRAARRLL